MKKGSEVGTTYAMRFKFDMKVCDECTSCWMLVYIIPGSTPPGEMQACCAVTRMPAPFGLNKIQPSTMRGGDHTGQAVLLVHHHFNCLLSTGASKSQEAFMTASQIMSALSLVRVCVHVCSLSTDVCETPLPSAATPPTTGGPASSSRCACCHGPLASSTCCAYERMCLYRQYRTQTPGRVNGGSVRSSRCPDPVSRLARHITWVSSG